MIDALPLVQLGLLLVRPGVLLLSAPVLGGAHAPAHVTIGLTVLLALALLPSAAVPATGLTVPMALVVAREAAIGLALGLALKAVLAAVELAGHLSGFQLGLSYAAIVDPMSGVRNNLVATMYANLVLVTFLLVNGHHAFLRALADSYESLPIGLGVGGAQMGASIPGSVATLLGLVFSLGTRLAAPLVLVLIVVEVAMALMARTAPMLNLMVVGAPMRLLVGLLLLGLMVPAVTRAATAAADVVVELGQQGALAFR